jgi:hypothetical protein
LATYSAFSEPFSEAPAVYHLWTALTIVSAVLKRGVFRDRKHFKTWPNLYTFLVGPPGTKKSSAINIGEKLLRQVQSGPYIIDTFHTAPFLVTTLGSISPNEKPPKTPYVIIADEAPAFFRRAKYAEDLIPVLIRHYDCKSGGAGGTQLRGLENIVDPYACGLWGVVPDILVDIMPPEVIRGGFASRVIWVYSDDTSKCIAFPENIPDPNPQLAHNLVHDLNEMRGMSGDINMTKEAEIAYETWYDSHKKGMVSQVDDPRRIGYANRKGELVFKVMILLSVIDGDSMMIEKKHFQQSLHLLEMLEPGLPKVYRATTREGQVMDNVEKVKNFILNVHSGQVDRSTLTKYCWNNGIMLTEQIDCLAQLIAQGADKEEIRGKQLWYVKT